MTEEITKKVKELGDLVRADERFVKVSAALEEYERCDELDEMIKEYNLEQDVIISKVGDDEARDVVQKRINELYDKITAHPVYAAYIDAKGDFDRFMNEVYAELRFAVTGERPCTHDCSTCGGCG